MSLGLYQYVHYLIYNYPLHDRQVRLMRVNNRTVFYFTQRFFSLLPNPYISNNHNPNKNLNLASQTTCDHMFSDHKSDHTFHVFWLHTCLIFCSFLYVEILHLLQRRKGVGIHFKLITN